jgi:hypothetical protein
MAKKEEFRGANRLQCRKVIAASHLQRRGLPTIKSIT